MRYLIVTIQVYIGGWLKKCFFINKLKLKNQNGIDTFSIKKIEFNFHVLKYLTWLTHHHQYVSDFTSNYCKSQTLLKI